MPLSPETLVHPRKSGVEVAAPDDPIRQRGWAITARPGGARTRTPEYIQARHEAAEVIYREAIDMMEDDRRPRVDDKQ